MITPLGRFSFGVSIAPLAPKIAYNSFRTKNGSRFLRWECKSWISELIIFTPALEHTDPKPQKTFGFVFRFLPNVNLNSINFYLTWDKVDPEIYSDFDDTENVSGRNWESSKFVVSFATQDALFLYERTQFDDFFPKELQNCSLVKTIKDVGYYYLDAINNSREGLLISLPGWTPGVISQIPFSVSWDKGNQMKVGNFSTSLATDEVLLKYKRTIEIEFKG